MSTSPVRCSHFTLGNPKKSFSTVLFIHTSDYLGYFRRKQTVIHLPTPSENVTTLTCEMQNFFVRLEVCCVLSNVWSLWREPVVGCFRWLWKEPVVICGNWSQASSVTASVQSDHMLPVIFDQSHSTPRCAEIQPMSLESATASLNMSISVHVLLLKHAPDAVLGLCK